MKEDVFVKYADVLSAVEESLKAKEGGKGVAKRIMNIQAANVREDKTAKMMLSRFGSGDGMIAWCSECRIVVNDFATYCWNCGARFTGKGIG